MMLTPIWEVLQLGYNVIYLDMDMTFLHNPLQTFFPFTFPSSTLLTGSEADQNVELTDFMFSVELRTFVILLLFCILCFLLGRWNPIQVSCFCDILHLF
jgi:hypothetical protein